MKKEILVIVVLIFVFIPVSCQNEVKKDNNTNMIAPVNGYSAIEMEVYRLINAHRTSIGLPSLEINDIISKQAKIHSINMANGKGLTHDGFENRIKEIDKFIKYSRGGENVAFNYHSPKPAKVAVDGWLKSPEHKKNIEGNFDLTGIGIVRNKKGEYYFTQIFIKRQK